MPDYGAAPGLAQKQLSSPSLLVAPEGKRGRFTAMAHPFPLFRAQLHMFQHPEHDVETRATPAHWHNTAVEATRRGRARGRRRALFFQLIRYIVRAEAPRRNFLSSRRATA